MILRATAVRAYDLKVRVKPGDCARPSIGGHRHWNYHNIRTTDADDVEHAGPPLVLQQPMQDGAERQPHQTARQGRCEEDGSEGDRQATETECAREKQPHPRAPTTDAIARIIGCWDPG